MRIRQAGSKNVYEFAAATVIVRPTSQDILDGLSRGRFRCQVHPVGRRPVYEIEVKAFFAWDAANRALAAWKEQAAR